MPVTSMVRQRLGGKTFTSYFPATAETAKDFADALMPGEYEILEKVGESGDDNVTDGYRMWVVMVKDTNDVKTYLSFATPLNKNSSDVISTLQDKTFNGVKADKVVIINSRTTQFANNDDSNS